MKPLFLDIDGVLNGHEKHPGSKYCGIRDDCMARLNRVVAATGCRLVLSSAWRYEFHNKNMTYTGLEYLLFTHGLVAEHGILTVTCRDEVIPTRERQILEYLERLGMPWVAAWAVVDDLDLDFGAEAGRFVRTHPGVGITDTDAARLIELLGEKTS